MSEHIDFNGRRFYRYPDSPHRSSRVYFSPHMDAAKAGVGRLHEEIWKSVHGEIPDGHHIHHIDGDPLNNDVGNLECLDPLTHTNLHIDDDRRQQMRDHAERIRPLTKAWHASEEGRVWHSEHAKRVWVHRQETQRVCEWCEAVYVSKSIQDRVRFCSARCCSAERRASGVDDEDRVCEFCGEQFSVNRYYRTTFCSRSCGQRSRRGHKPGVRPDGG